VEPGADVAVGGKPAPLVVLGRRISDAEHLPPVRTHLAEHDVADLGQLEGLIGEDTDHHANEKGPEGEGGRSAARAAPFGSFPTIDGVEDAHVVDERDSEAEGLVIDHPVGAEDHP
jgi:hypothetical protein